MPRLVTAAAAAVLAMLLLANSWMYAPPAPSAEVPAPGELTQLLMFAQKYPTFGYECGGARARSPSACLTFDNTEVPAGTYVEEATLWIYKRRDGRDGLNQKFVIDELLPREYEQRLRRTDSHLTTTDIKEDWLQADVTQVVARWLGKSYQHRRLKVVCKTCVTSPKYAPIDYQGEHRPLIVVNTRPPPAPPRRLARSANTLQCGESSGGHCCLTEFNITFSDIGINFITEPAAFAANYCSGSCATPGVVSTKYMVSHYLQNQAVLVQEAALREALTPCCSPLRLEDLSVIYRNDTGPGFLKQDLQNMSIQKCACA